MNPIVTVVIMLITPEIAAQMLSGNTINRRVRTYTVNVYAEIMRRGAWVLSPDALCFDPRGKLLNGQHRLLAVIQCGIPQEFVVVRGVGTDSFRVLDTGSRRQVSDVLQIMGHKNYIPLAATAKRLALYTRRGVITRSVATAGSVGVPGTNGYTDLNDQVQIANEYDPIHDAVEYAVSRKVEAKHLAFAPSIISFLYSLYAPWHPGIEDFLNRVLKRRSRDGEDPADHLAARLLASAASPSNMQLDVPTKLGYAIVAANHDFKGTRMKRLIWPKTDNYPQPLTQIAERIANHVGWESVGEGPE